MKKLFVTLMVSILAGFGVAQAQLPAVTLKTIDGATVQTSAITMNPSTNSLARPSASWGLAISASEWPRLHWPSA